MHTTLTIRMENELREKLRRRAELLKKTDSELVREILNRELSDAPLHARTGHLKGRLSLKRARGRSWRDELRARNWRR
jgi:hypothetical protein